MKTKNHYKIIIYILLFVVLMISCEQKLMQKPFIIISKGIIITKGKVKYWYQDRNGRVEYFYDKDIYSVGDTLK